jgi:hypothetical protein
MEQIYSELVCNNWLACGFISLLFGPGKLVGIFAYYAFDVGI